MNILSTQYQINRKTFEIYLSGCKGKFLDGSTKKVHCKGCHNEFSWNFKNGELWDDYYNKSIRPSIASAYESNVLEHIWVLGGEPLDQHPRELFSLLKNLENNAPRSSIWLFTGYSIEWVRENYTEVFKFIDYIKVGHFDEDNLNDNYIEEFNLTLKSEQKLYRVLNEDGNIIEEVK